jgi:hypothetical protein
LHRLLALGGSRPLDLGRAQPKKFVVMIEGDAVLRQAYATRSTTVASRSPTSAVVVTLVPRRNPASPVSVRPDRPRLVPLDQSNPEDRDLNALLSEAESIFLDALDSNAKSGRLLFRINVESLVAEVLMNQALAHLGGFGGDHILVEHLRDVASEARELATATGCDDPTFLAMTEWAGWLHDLGKHRNEFQESLNGRRFKSVETPPRPRRRMIR